MDKFLAYLIPGIFTGSAYAIAASGLVLTYTTTRVFNIAHGAFSLPKIRTSVVAKDWVPPECSSTAPKMAPIPMIVAMNPKAPPILSTIVWAT